MINQKDMTFDDDFCYSFSFSSSLFFLRRVENKQSCGQKSCLSAQSIRIAIWVFFSIVPLKIIAFNLLWFLFVILIDLSKEQRVFKRNNCNIERAKTLGEAIDKSLQMYQKNTLSIL